MEDQIKQLKLIHEPSEIYDIVPLSSEFKDTYALSPIFNSKHTNPQYNIQNQLRNKNIPIRNPFLYKVTGAQLFGHSNLIATSSDETSLSGLVFTLNNSHKFFAGEDDKFKVLQNGIIQVCYKKRLNFENGLFLGGSDNFGHWLLNCVSRLNYLEFLDKNIPIIIHDYMPQRFVDCLSYFLDKNPIIKIPKQTLCIFENLYVGTTSWFLDNNSKAWWNSDSVVFLNKRFTNNKVKKENKKIFLSRKTSKWRKLVNEDIIYSQLKELNFEYVDIENLSLNEQINLAFNSDIIISPLGAGCLTYLFADKGTKCITFSPSMSSAMFLADLYCGPINLLHKYIYGNITIKDDIDINSDYHIDQNINWDQFFNQVVVN